MTSINTHKIVLSGLLVASGIVIPFIFHATGAFAAGSIFLPMHLPVMVAGFVLGPFYGCFTGIICPLIGSITMQMPALARLPFMIIELFTYGLVSGLLSRGNNPVRTFRFVICILLTQIAGRLAYALAVLFAAGILGMSSMSPVIVLYASATGIPGIVIQLVLVPFLVRLLKNSHRIPWFKINP